MDVWMMVFLDGLMLYFFFIESLKQPYGFCSYSIYYHYCHIRGLNGRNFYKIKTKNYLFI